MKRDKAYLRHILDAILSIEGFLEGLVDDRFSQNIEKHYAVLRELEIIRIATKNLGRELKEKCPEVPWIELASMRD
jgi:uncharacterized protein with HEPN domain